MVFKNHLCYFVSTSCRLCYFVETSYRLRALIVINMGDISLFCAPTYAFFPCGVTKQRVSGSHLDQESSRRSLPLALTFFLPAADPVPTAVLILAQAWTMTAEGMMIQKALMITK